MTMPVLKIIECGTCEDCQSAYLTSHPVAVEQMTFDMEVNIHEDNILRMKLLNERFFKIVGNFSIGGTIHFIQDGKLYRISGAERSDLRENYDFVSAWRPLLRQELATGSPDYLKLWLLMTL